MHGWLLILALANLALANAIAQFIVAVASPLANPRGCE
jgi:hypothetical protein